MRWQISKLLSVIDFALSNSASDDKLFGEMNLAPPEELKKRAPGVFQFEVRNDKKEVEHWCVDPIENVLDAGADVSVGGPT